MHDTVLDIKSDLSSLDCLIYLGYFVLGEKDYCYHQMAIDLFI